MKMDWIEDTDAALNEFEKTHKLSPDMVNIMRQQSTDFLEYYKQHYEMLVVSARSSEPILSLMTSAYFDCKPIARMAEFIKLIYTIGFYRGQIHTDVPEQFKF